MNPCLIAVIADSHGLIPDTDTLYKRVTVADMVIHCGDGYRDGLDIASHTGKPVIQVLGNNDFCEGKNEETLDLNGHRIFIAHGHNHRVRGGDRYTLAHYAASQGATITCFGHTHRYEYTMVNDIHIFNPGNLTPTERQREGTLGFIRLHADNGTPDFWCERVY